MLLHTGRVACPQDGQQFLITDEVEAWEGTPLGIKVLAKALLAYFQLLCKGPKLSQPEKDMQQP